MGAGTVAETGRERRIDSKRPASEPLITSSGLRSGQFCDSAAVPVSSAPKQTEARVIICVRRATILNVMPADPNDYRTRGGNLAIVLCCPNIVSRARLVYFDHNPAGNWVIRDFLAGVTLSNKTSALTVDDIEQDASHSEPPPWCNVETAPRDWRLYLELRTTVVREQRNRNVDVQHPNPQSGQWEPL